MRLLSLTQRYIEIDPPFSLQTPNKNFRHDSYTGFIRGILRGVRYAKSLRVLFLHRRSPSWTTLVLYSRVVFIFNEPTNSLQRTWAELQSCTGFIRGILRGVRFAKSLRVLFLHRRSPSWTTLVLYSRAVFFFNEPTNDLWRMERIWKLFN